MSHERPPEQQSTVLRRVAIALTVVAVLLLIASTVQLLAAAGAAAAVAAVATLEVAAYVRGNRQKQSILGQLRGGANPQLVDAVGTTLPNRMVLLLALAVAAVVAAVGFLIIGAFA